MANHKSAKKTHLKSLKNRDRNLSILNRIKTFIGKVETLIKENNTTDVRAAFSVAESEIMKGVSKGVLKLNTASRKVSLLNKKVKALVLKKDEATV